MPNQRRFDVMAANRRGFYRDSRLCARWDYPLETLLYIQVISNNILYCGFIYIEQRTGIYPYKGWTEVLTINMNNSAIRVNTVK